jgi:hypothetical protein
MSTTNTPEILSIEQLDDVTGGARVYARSGNDAALTTALTSVQSSLDSLKYQNNNNNNSLMLMLPMAMMMRQRNGG